MMKRLKYYLSTKGNAKPSEYVADKAVEKLI